ncbi:MAG: hypothetical protein U5L04_02620 [Trueperaceae bacterium]|nr:hypothetical protein [Trueperaceae bacterium]
MIVYYDINDDLDQVAAHIDIRLRDWPGADLIDLANRGIQLIEERTEQGQDMHGRSFVAYSPQYAEFRRATGRQAERVDLLYEGHMRTNMTPKAGDGAAIIFFPDQTEGVKAMAHHEGTATISARPWFGFVPGTADMQALQAEALRLASNRLSAAE